MKLGKMTSRKNRGERTAGMRTGSDGGRIMKTEVGQWVEKYEIRRERITEARLGTRVEAMKGNLETE